MIDLRTLGSADLYDSDGRSLQSVVAQPKRFALLTYLALATPRGYHRRDVLVALFWPELDAEHARAALRKIVHYLRQSLGKDVILGRGDEELSLDAHRIRCDAARFEEAVADGRAGDALALYAGELLPGFHLPDAPEFEQWLEAERTRLKQLAARAANTVAREAETAGNMVGAIQFARRALALGAGESALRRLLELYHRTGDVASAIAEFETYRQRLAAEYDVAPSAETQALIDTLRAGSRARNATAAPVPPSASAPVPVVTAHPPPVRRRTRFRWIALVAGSAAVVGGVWVTTNRRDSAQPPVLAVGTIQDLTGVDNALYARALPDLLASNLARAEQLQVISPARMYEVLGMTSSDASAAALPTVARKVGANQLIEGALYRLQTGLLRLDLRRVDLESGAVRDALTVQGADLFALVDSATAGILRTIGPRTATLRIADVTTSSLEAFGLYQQGLRTLYQDGDRLAAHKLFASALAQDSTFAMAAYYAAMNPDGAFDPEALQRAADLAARASARERLLIRATLAYARNTADRLIVAESLATRFPAEPDGPYLLAQGKVWAGDFLDGARLLRLVVEMDSLGLRGNRLYCRGCEALAELATAYTLADSIPAALRTARELVRVRPRAATSWGVLNAALESAEIYDEALSAGRTHTLLQPVNVDAVLPAIIGIRTAQFRQADSILSPLRQSPRANLRVEASWYYIISLRNQGRYDEALRVAQQLRSDDHRNGVLTEAIVRYDMGEAARAASLFEQALGPLNDSDDSRFGSRGRSWVLLHVAVAHAAAGDTASLPDYAQRLQRHGALSRYGRDPRLHHHVRGLLHAARGHHAAAVEEFRQAIFSSVAGYTRTNLEMARSLLQLRRPAEAVAILQPAFRGAGLSASNLYVTHTELRETLGQAHEALGQRDSAAVHYRWVSRAWVNADSQLRDRRENIRRRLATVSR